MTQPERSSHNRQIGSRAVIALGAVLITSVLAITSYEIWRQRTVALTTASTSLQTLSLTLAEQTERSFRNVERVIDSAVESVIEAGGIRNAGSPDLHKELTERSTGVPQIDGMAVFDYEGKALNTLNIWPTPAMTVSDREYFQYHRDHDDTSLHIGIPVVNKVTGRESIIVSKRINGPDGSFQGVVAVTIPPEYFNETYARVLPPHNSAFALFRTDGILLVRAPPAPGAKLGKSYGHLPDFQPGAPTQGLVSAPSPMDGIMRMVAFHTMSRYPMKVNLSIDEDMVLSSWRGNTTRLTLFGLSATVLLTILISMLVRHMRRDEDSIAQLRESEQRLRLAQFTLDQAADMVFWATMDGRVIYANKAACDRTGITPEEAKTLTVAELDPEYSAEMWRGILECLEKEGSVRYEAIHRPRGSAPPFPVDVVITTVSWEGRRSLCAFVRDISDRKRAEAELAEKTQSLEASNAELEQFAYVASHDLREPLRMVNSFVSLLSKRFGDKLDQEAREYIAYAQDGAVRMDRLILDLLEYSRVGRLDRPLSPTSFGGCVELARRSLRIAIEETGASIEVAPDLPTVMANEEELVRLLVNLMANALKYRHPDRAPRIRIDAVARGDDILCRVEDNGIGIQTEYFERIFRIFQRLHGRERYDGTGIGLAICKKIIERHGGRIWVESEPDQGSTFLFTLKPGISLLEES